MPSTVRPIVRLRCRGADSFLGYAGLVPMTKLRFVLAHPDNLPPDLTVSFGSSTIGSVDMAKRVDSRLVENDDELVVRVPMVNKQQQQHQ